MFSYVIRCGISVVNATAFSAADRRGHLHRLYCVSPPHLSVSSEEVKWNPTHSFEQILTPECTNISLHFKLCHSVRNFCCQFYDFFGVWQMRTLVSIVLCFRSSFIRLEWKGEVKVCTFECIDLLVKSKTHTCKYTYLWLQTFAIILYFWRCLVMATHGAKLFLSDQ